MSVELRGSIQDMAGSDKRLLQLPRPGLRGMVRAGGSNGVSL
jgi:hypothetical protein